MAVSTRTLHVPVLALWNSYGDNAKRKRKHGKTRRLEMIPRISDELGEMVLFVQS
jgi:hypothetical protein